MRSHRAAEPRSAICLGLGSYEWGFCPGPTSTRTRKRPSDMRWTKYCWGRMLTTATGGFTPGPAAARAGTGVR